jgi:tRNA nucleotidyltransferase (CCA-adding enzyme)
MQEILKKALLEIKPEQKNVKEAEEFLTKLNKEIKKNRIKATATPGGSYAKNTWLKGDYDVDVFVKFDLKHKTNEISKLLGRILKKFKPIKLHGSRDYYWVQNSLRFEIIPVLNIAKANQAMNTTDFSPWHVAWVNRQGSKYKDDIRLAKKFMKTKGCYGAESYIKGFSGHVVDILVIYYGGFLPLLRAAVKWKPKVIVDYYNKVGKNAEFILNKSKIQGPMIIIDPVQPERNAAAALSQEMFDLFVASAKKFLQNPSDKYFEYQELDLEKMKRKGKLLLIDVEVPEGKEDPVGAKLVKAFEFLAGKLEDFGVIRKEWEWDKYKNAVFVYLLKKEKLPETYEQPGPPVIMQKEMLKFKKKHKRIFVKNKKAWAKVLYEHRTPEELLKKVFKHEYLTDKVKKCTLKKS